MIQGFLRFPASSGHEGRRRLPLGASVREHGQDIGVGFREVSIRRAPEALDCSWRAPPDRQRQPQGREIDSFLGKPVTHPSSARLLRFGANDPGFFKFSQPVGQDIRSNSLPAPWNSLNVQYPFTIKSRIKSSDQRSPKLSRDMLTGHPER
jgi:hypothetical protein